MIKILNIQIIEDRIIYTVDIVSVIKHFVFTMVQDIQNLNQLIKEEIDRVSSENP